MRAFLLLLIALPVGAQVESVKLHFGDDMRWADPAFDDSGWLDGNSRAVIDAHLLETMQWARYKFRVPRRILDPAIGAAIPTIEVYVEGRLIGRSGQLPPQLRDAPMKQNTWLIPSDLAQPGRLLTVAFRIWRFPGYDLRRLTNLNLAPALTVYNAGETPIHEASQRSVMWGRVWAIAITGFLILFLAMSGPAQWTKTESLLLASYLFCNISGYVLLVAGSYLPFGNRCFALIFLAFPFAYALQLELLAHVANVKPGWWLRSAQALNFLADVPLCWAGFQVAAPPWTSIAGKAYGSSLVGNFAAAFVVAMLQRTGDIGARTLTWGLVLFFLAAIKTNIPIVVGEVTFNFNIVGNILFGAILVAVHLRRLRKSSGIAVRLQAQFAAARSVQTMLLSGRAEATPRYVIDPVYRPADEVGGDFFRILPAPGDATLVVVGDVSGKGLRAAMLVSVIVGALLNRRSNEPSDVLTELNRALSGQMEGGFVTCCCALLRPGGEVTLANAGHPPPHSKHGEVDAPAALPLGIVPDVPYGSRALRLEIEDRLTFLSDGVVEAANPAGELFGFERARAISAKSAEEIADAASAWGQNDDITVVAVKRVA